MKRTSFHSIPALWVAALFATGIFIGKSLELPTLPSIAIVLVLFITAAILYVMANPRRSVFLSLTLIVLILSVGANKIHFDTLSNPSLNDSLLTRQVTVVGRIVEAPSTVENKTRFLLQMESIEAPSIMLAEQVNVLVTVTRQKKDTIAIPFIYGSKVRLTAQLDRPSEERNPGEFNSRAYYEAQGIGLVMRVRGYRNVSVVDLTPAGGVFNSVMSHVVLPVRFYILSLIDKTIGGEEGELLKGIFIGERGGIPFATRTAFTNSGIAHILAVSGSNVVVVFAFFTALIGLMRVPRNVNIILTSFVLLFYMILTGSQPPIVRATVMTLIILFGKILGEKSNALNSLGVAALLILAYDARQLFDVGFQLSFLAVLSIVYLYPIVNAQISKIQVDNSANKAAVFLLRVAAVSLVATLGTLPLTAFYFGKVSVVGLLTNGIILPIVGASVMLGFVSSLFGWMSFFVADAFAAVNGLLLTLSLAVAKLSGGLSWAYVETLQFKPVHAIPYFAALGVLFHLHIGSVARKMIIAFLVSLNILLFVPTSSSEKSHEGLLRASFIDVGQGDAALVEFPDGKTMLIDAGPKSGDYDSGERIIVPFLKRRGIERLDYLIASHPHADHIGGFASVFKGLDVNTVLESGQPARDPIYLEYTKALHLENCRVDTARSGQPAIQIGGANLYVLYPTPSNIDADTSQSNPNINNTSVVVKLCYGATSILFMGDAEREAEEEIVESYGDFLQSTLLKTGHHGSITSSSQEFLHAVNPKIAIISVGLHNKFNHPSEEVVERLRAMNAEPLRTDEEGAIIFESDGKKMNRILWR